MKEEQLGIITEYCRLKSSKGINTPLANHQLTPPGTIVYSIVLAETEIVSPIVLAMRYNEVVGCMLIYSPESLITHHPAT